MSITCQVVTESGRFRENQRGHVAIDVEAADLCTIQIITQTHIERIVLSGDHLEALQTELGKAVRKAKRAKLRSVVA